MREEFQEIILLINENNFVKAEEIFENLLMEKISEKIVDIKDEVISKLNNLKERKSKKLTDKDLERISSIDMKEREKNEMDIPFRYFIDKDAVYAEIKGRNPVLVYIDGEFAY